MSYFKERVNKRFLLHSCKAVVFILVILGLLFALSPVFMPKTNKDLRDSSANGILAEPAGTIDVIIVGDSEAYCTFIPLQMWNDYGITSYVCGTPKQTLDYSEDFLRKAFKSQKPKVVVLETNSVSALLFLSRLMNGFLFTDIMIAGKSFPYRIFHLMSIMIILRMIRDIV